MSQGGNRMHTVVVALMVGTDPISSYKKSQLWLRWPQWAWSMQTNKDSRSKISQQTMWVDKVLVPAIVWHGIVWVVWDEHVSVFGGASIVVAVQWYSGCSHTLDWHVPMHGALCLAAQHRAGWMLHTATPMCCRVAVRRVKDSDVLSVPIGSRCLKKILLSTASEHVLFTTTTII